MTDVPLNTRTLVDQSLWLEENMANPPLPEPQRWDLVEMPGRYTTKWVLRFHNDHDATLYALRWA